ncbi:MAG: hypothetical protein JW788_04010 [Candidatus Omnitrophica bacterium]|nr:hypothetical protein [Candidatus Omnitrophota bacterium]
MNKLLGKISSVRTVFTHLSKREKSVLYITVCAVSFLLLDRLVISPVFSRITSLNKEILERKTAIRKNMLILSQKDRIASESAKYATFLSKMKSEDEEMTLLLKEIESLANKTNISLIDMKPTGLKSAGPYKKFLVNLNCEAQMEQVLDFMYNIENSSKLLIIERYQLGPKARESSIARCSMTIAKIFMP